MKSFKLTNEQTGSVCQALAYLLEAGLENGDALLVLARDEESPHLHHALEAMAAQTDRGAPLHTAFSQAGCFPDYACRLLEVGEQVGKTSQTLSRLARYYRQRSALQDRLKAMLTYPGVLLGVLVGVLVVLLVWVMPVFQEVYAGLGTQLTGFSRWLLTLGRGLGKVLPWLGAGLGAMLLALAFPAVRRALTGLWKKLWGDRGPGKAISSARYLQALSLGIGCGLAQEEAAALASHLAAGDVPGFAQRCEKVRQDLASGQNLPQALAQGGFVGAADRRLLEAGSRSGHGDQALETIAEDSLRRSEADLERSLGRIEPAMVALACGLIAAVLISVMVPLVSMMSLMG